MLQWQRHLALHVPFTTTEQAICPGWETLFVPVSQPGTPGRDKRGHPFAPFCPRSSNRDKRHPFVPVGKGLPAPRGWRTLLSRLVLPTGTKGPFFSPHFFSISIILSFLIYFHFNYTNKCKYILICIILVPNNLHI